MDKEQETPTKSKPQEPQQIPAAIQETTKIQTDSPQTQPESKPSQANNNSPSEIEVTVEPKAEVKPKKRVRKKAVVVQAKPSVGPLPNYRQNIKLFGKWSTDVEVKDQGLKPYINLNAIVVPYSAGRAIKKQFWKSKKSIVERLTTKLMVSGHKGKKHYWTSNVGTGKVATHYRLIVQTFNAIEKKTKKNPVEVLVRALETGTPREGVATIEYGGVRYPKAADMAPQRRIDLALRWMIQGAFVASRKHKKAMSDALADEIIATAANDAKATCITKKTELERQAAASR